MRYLRFILMLLLVVPMYTGRSQDVIYSAYERFDHRDGEYSVVGMTGGRLYNYYNSINGAMLEAFDDSMNRTATILLDFFPNKIYQTRFISYADKIVILYQALESNKVVQYAALLDDRGRLKDKPIELWSAKTSIFGAMKNYFYSVVSDDKKKILIYSLNEKGNNVEFEGKWLDDSLRILKKSKATFSGDKQMSSGDVCINNDGTVFMSAYTTAGAQNYADQYWLLSLGQGENKFVPHAMNLSGKFAASGYLKIDNVNGRVYFGGYYTNKKNGSYEGIIFASYDIPSANYQNLKFIPFDSDLAAAAGARQKNHPFDNYVVKQLIVKNDGGFVMMSEISYITTRTTYTPGFGYYSSFYSPNSSTMIREYHYNDIMALAYNKDGVKEWQSIIPKEQYSQEDGGIFSSYLLLNSGGSLAFLYNDFNTSRSRIQLATLDPGGKTLLNAFSVDDNDGRDWLPRAGKQVASRVLIIPCLRKKQICFAKVMF